MEPGPVLPPPYLYGTATIGATCFLLQCPPGPHLPPLLGTVTPGLLPPARPLPQWLPPPRTLPLPQHTQGWHFPLDSNRKQSPPIFSFSPTSSLFLLFFSSCFMTKGTPAPSRSYSEAQC